MTVNASGQPIPITRPTFPDTQLDALLGDLRSVLKSGQLAPGEYAKRFETAFAEFCGVPHAVSVNSATTALQIALRYADVAGYDVLVPAASFITDVSSVLFEGGNPVLVDVDADSLAVTPRTLSARRTPRTKAIIWVHLTGIVSPEYKAVREYAQSEGLFLIEDASHAHGATLGKLSAGQLGDVGVFSFFPTKLMTTGAGGMITTFDGDLARFARELRMFGKKEGTSEVVYLGNDWFLDELRSCVGLHQLQCLPDVLRRRREVADHYFSRLSNQPGLRLPQIHEGHVPSWYQFPVFIDDPVLHKKCSIALQKAGIQSKQIYRPVHREKVFENLVIDEQPVAEQMLAASLCLPMYAELDLQDVDRVSDVLIRVLRSVT
ncbi:DegT/DnrJ/EryC1/StrS family aminotransferase [Roseobacter sp. HKCCD7870]|uniref:DegT/DnrJ/EryC1/StrS family aminotransferase n=1 Tax=Roseobacter sp. HKCCD7870 TaxID=3120343 RepID=UPI0030EF2FDA